MAETSLYREEEGATLEGVKKTFQEGNHTGKEQIWTIGVKILRGCTTHPHPRNC